MLTFSFTYLTSHHPCAYSDCVPGMSHREGNDPADDETVTYGELLKDVCRVANVLKAKGVAKGDRVAIYMPMIKELVVAMLAVARIGAVHSIVVSKVPSVCLYSVIEQRTLCRTSSSTVTRPGRPQTFVLYISGISLDHCTAASTEWSVPHILPSGLYL